ncbi:class I SAM-dependent methyltransferase [Zavarzinia compransoris]|uniref:Methyltransferase n=1 Tax=Zavarzinia compransoris TaxID=1264899 RepID=A0A317DZ00_9PROT|nr:SAM-dependent methyltransferase [Zavarzinia compransoris]PWR20008.1 methyltransferase [Zavarzinia compransoris]TDP44873.1 NADH dehydrogenase [ubiquinone] 1 alpha subcomplex assembly factor 7 [Zavarzinia compransoris]
MTPLAASLASRIALDGPLPVSTVMAEALSHPRFGYYMVREPFGSAGDFITAPEISQMFGELLGLWLGAVWMAMGAPAAVHLVELGPGRGTLMADARRSLARVPGFPLDRPVHLVETSARLRAIQAATIKAPVVHHDHVDQLPGDAPLLVVANEFFDALPIRQFVFTPRGFHERVVGLDAAGALCFGLAPAAAEPGLLPAHDRPAPGDLLEWCPAGSDIARTLGARLARQGGAALLIDYGAAHRGFADTLQALAGHAYADVLATLGQADVTAHVNFTHLAEAAAAGGARAHGPVTQGQLLAALGIDARAARLAAANPDKRETVARACERLTAPGQMGSLFKALALTHPALAVPPAFESPP